MSQRVSKNTHTGARALEWDAFEAEGMPRREGLSTREPEGGGGVGELVATLESSEQ